MKKFKKSLLTLSLIVSATMAFSSSAIAATSQSGAVSGYSTSASLSMGSSSASATTTCGTTAGLTAYVSYTYGWGPVGDVYTVTSNASNGSTSVTATASAGHYNPSSVKASGSHSVYYNSQSWSANTST